eukprot:65291-Amphidinium_carterae.2
MQSGHALPQVAAEQMVSSMPFPFVEWLRGTDHRWLSVQRFIGKSLRGSSPLVVCAAVRTKMTRTRKNGGWLHIILANNPARDRPPDPQISKKSQTSALKGVKSGGVRNIIRFITTIHMLAKLAHLRQGLIHLHRHGHIRLGSAF